MTEVASIKATGAHGEPEMKGWLFKWTNYLKGYQRRWFVLQNGLLSYYRAENNGGSKLSIRRRRRNRRSGNQAEMAHTCRGNISLHGALIHTVDSCSFVISNGGTQTFHIKTNSEVERQSWVTALELAKVRAIRSMESEEEEEEGGADGAASSEELDGIVRQLQARLEDMQTCSELIAKHGSTLQRLLGELENQPGGAGISPSATSAQQSGGSGEVESRSKAIGERATLFRIASNAMINACSEYLSVAKAQGHRWVRVLQHEREQRQRLEEMVEQLARQHSHLEMAASSHGTAPAAGSDDDDDNEFYDCDNEASVPSQNAGGGGAPNGGGSGANTGGSGTSNNPSGGSTSGTNSEDSAFVMNIPVSSSHRRNPSDSSDEGDNPGEDGAHSNPRNAPPETKQVLFVSTSDEKNPDTPPSTSVATNRRQRRTRVPDKPNHPLNLWSIMKNCIGKDLSKIPMPVNFSEPLSMLQRLTEDYEYAEVLDAAADCTDPCEQLAYVAAFTISSYSTTSNRTGKPFNPLLGETYECDRTEDLGWRAISEQVSHHPPMVAQYCEGAKWRCWQEFTMTSKFRGKYLQVIPMGTAHVEFLPTGNRYSWRKVTTTVHNIIVGKLWVDHHGDMEIIGRAGEAVGLTCHLKYVPYSYFTRDVQRRVKGCVTDADNAVRWVVNGTWDHKVDVAPVLDGEGSTVGATSSQDSPMLKTGAAVTAWKRRPPPPDSDKYYGFTLLAAQLNEEEEGVAPTDSRLRPDQRLMELGQWDRANQEKLRLEEKQRAARRRLESEYTEALAAGRDLVPYEPLWFVKKRDPDLDAISHVYRGNYWQCKERQDWSRCPDIF